MARPGRKRVFDPSTAADRKRARKARENMMQRRVATWVREHHPRIYNQARDAALAEILAEHGPLPGGEPDD